MQGAGTWCAVGHVGSDGARTSTPPGSVTIWRRPACPPPRRPSRLPLSHTAASRAALLGRPLRPHTHADRHILAAPLAARLPSPPLWSQSTAGGSTTGASAAYELPARTVIRGPVKGRQDIVWDQQYGRALLRIVPGEEGEGRRYTGVGFQDGVGRGGMGMVGVGGAHIRWFRRTYIGKQGRGRGRQGGQRLASNNNNPPSPGCKGPKRPVSPTARQGVPPKADGCNRGRCLCS